VPGVSFLLYLPNELLSQNAFLGVMMGEVKESKMFVFGLALSGLATVYYQIQIAQLELYRIMAKQEHEKAKADRVAEHQKREFDLLWGEFDRKTGKNYDDLLL
jgi:hypothetical protein